MSVGKWFAKEVVTVSPKDALADVAEMMDRHNVGTVVVVEDQRPVGIVTDRDLALALGARGHSLRTPAATVMSAPVTVIDHDQEILSATQFMMNYEVRRLPIVDDDGRLVGMVTLDDLIRLLGRELHNLAEGIKLEMQVR